MRATLESDSSDRSGVVDAATTEDNEVAIMQNSSAPALRARGERKSTPERRQEIVRAAAKTFGTKGYQKGSLIDIAAQVGMTHAGVLHHFGSKEQLLIAVLKYRDEEDIQSLPSTRMPQGLEMFRHLVRTALVNTQRVGLVQTYAALTGESVTENHPARGFVIERFSVLRAHLEECLREYCGPELPADLCTYAATSIIGVMDGIQLQWLLQDDAVDLPESTRFALEAILVAAKAGAKREHPLAGA